MDLGDYPSPHDLEQVSSLPSLRIFFGRRGSSGAENQKEGRKARADLASFLCPFSCLFPLILPQSSTQSNLDLLINAISSDPVVSEQQILQQHLQQGSPNEGGGESTGYSLQEVLEGLAEGRRLEEENERRAEVSRLLSLMTCFEESEVRGLKKSEAERQRPFGLIVLHLFCFPPYRNGKLPNDRLQYSTRFLSSSPRKASEEPSNSRSSPATRFSRRSRPITSPVRSSSLSTTVPLSLEHI